MICTKHKVSLKHLSKACPPCVSFSEWCDSLPDILGAKTLRHVADIIVQARSQNHPVVFAYGGHVIKTGCSSLIVDLISRDIITAVATNGSGAIHDFELARNGTTSEDIDQTLQEGSFGMASDTMAFMNAVLETAKKDNAGLGETIGRCLQGGSPKCSTNLGAVERSKPSGSAR